MANSKHHALINWFRKQSADMSQKNMFSDQAHFKIGGYDNEQNLKTLQTIDGKPLHVRVTIWSTL